MAAITVRGLSDETHRALKARAAAHRRSTEAEVRAILDAAVAPPDRVRLGSLLAGIGREAGGVDLDISRDRTPSEPIDLG
ncbi:MAG: antitoxin [Micropruina sp.]|uniref:FitA-like ribbon-helix-helix domain-containing protein n=1 Tax=Micropruina sp. TaxID=2737536 RepID=UPI0039E4C192